MLEQLDMEEPVELVDVLFSNCEKMMLSENPWPEEVEEFVETEQ
jgi:hypothetical protein